MGENVLTSNICDIPGSKAAPLLWGTWFLKISSEEKKKCRTMFLLGHW